MISSLELARICGVSQGTVDRALHGRGEIRAATKARILNAARKYGYRPNPLVRELLSGKSRTVGALIPGINSIFFLDLMNEIKTALQPAGRRLLLEPVADAQEFLHALEDFAARRCRAVLAVPPAEGLKIPATIAREMPVICLVSPCRGKNVHFISPDEEQTGRDAVDLLFVRGHRRIVHLTYTRRAYGIEARARGYRRRMRELRLTPLIVAGGIDGTDGTGAPLFDVVRAQRPTALFCHNDWLALAAVRTLEKNGLAVPRDISVLGIDASPMFRALHAGITTLQYPFKAVAAQVSELIESGKTVTTIGRFEILEGTTVREMGA
jgi:LacI family transcriptional regulator